MRWKLLFIVMSRWKKNPITESFPEVLIFLRELVNRHVRLVDLFGHRFQLQISPLDLTFTFPDLSGGFFQAVSALEYRKRAFIMT